MSFLLYLECSVPQMWPGTIFELRHVRLFPNQAALGSQLHDSPRDFNKHSKAQSLRKDIH